VESHRIYSIKKSSNKNKGNRKPRGQTEKKQTESQQGRWKPRNQIKAKMKAEMYIKGETNYSLADVVLKNVVIKLD